MRTVVYRYDDLVVLSEALERARGQALPVPTGANVRDGEWVLAMFELAESARATAAAGRGALLEEGIALVFERRDWDRLRSFARPSAKARAAPPVPSRDDDATEPQEGIPSDLFRSGVHATSLGSTSAWERPPPSEAPPSQTARILVCDDDPDFREILAAMLEAVGLVVEAVASGEEALARAGSFDLLVLDWTLPGMSGLDVCRELRRRPAESTTPVLFLTAHAGMHEMVEAFAAGADDFVAKPFRAPELGARIFGLLRRARPSQRRR